MTKETNKFTLTFTGEQLQVLSDIAHSVSVNKVVLWDDLITEQKLDLVEVGNLIQKQLDFPNLKF